ncbi:hypothetical protein HaLaN_02292 [Haematococcus lacustris]|uniref:Uncharacterized protein n=1 Tax=Haematococcus lacustris TaxID=44745 RepID=A0A699YDN2_HAELA|nr:hypothetical protein HaLaN_02292 [Haematococcus lacustris]
MANSRLAFAHYLLTSILAHGSEHVPLATLRSPSLPKTVLTLTSNRHQHELDRHDLGRSLNYTSGGPNTSKL